MGNKEKMLIVRDLDDGTLEKIDKQKKKYGIKSRSEYIRLLVNVDLLTNILNKFNEDYKK